MSFPHWLYQGQRRRILTAVHEALQFTSPAVVLDHILVHYIAQWLSAQCTQHAEFSAHISQTDPASAVDGLPFDTCGFFRCMSMYV